MADFTALKTAIQNAIKQNGNEEITGAILQEVMLAVVSTLGDSAINDLVTALSTEVTNRQNADGTLQSNINAEQSARQLGDSTLQSGINNERDLRIAADNTLQNAINAINIKLAEGYLYVGIATTSTNPSTPSGKVFYMAVAAGTYTNFLNSSSQPLVLTQGINILKFNGTSWSVEQVWGVDDTPTPSSNNLVKSGGVFNDIMTNGSAFDLTAYNNGTTYADLNAALTALNALPAAYKKGGMSLKYVQTYDNKYVQYRLMSDSFNTTVTNWSFCGDDVYVEDLEYLEYETDSQGKFLYGIRKDGEFIFGNDCPEQIKSYIKSQKTIVQINHNKTTGHNDILIDGNSQSVVGSEDITKLGLRTITCTFAGNYDYSPRLELIPKGSVILSMTGMSVINLFDEIDAATHERVYANNTPFVLQSDKYYLRAYGESGTITLTFCSEEAVKFGYYINVNELINKSSAFDSLTSARNAVSTSVRKKGLTITFLLSDGWHTEQFIGSDVSSWSTASNWSAIAQIKVNNDILFVGGNSLGVLGGQIITNTEWLKTVTDSNGRILLGINKEGDGQIFGKFVSEKISTKDLNTNNITASSIIISPNGLISLKNDLGIEDYNELIKLRNKEKYLVVSQWNVGQFGYGIAHSTITPENYNVMAPLWNKEVIDEYVNLFGLIEYNPVFGTNPNNQEVSPDDVVWNNYPNKIVYRKIPATIDYYGGNAINTMFPISNSERKTYSCFNSIIDDPNTPQTIKDMLISVFYTYTEILYKGVEVKVIETSCPFNPDNLSDGTYQRLLYNELAETYKNEPFVILMGDFELVNKSDYDIFKNKGYTLCNGGDFGWFPTCPNPFVSGVQEFDNIILKGFDVLNVEMSPSNLSDHYPLIATLDINVNSNNN